MKPIDNSENESKCICAKCPVYNECAKNNSEILYCAQAKSKCSLDANKMCICGECSVYVENKLSGGYFCLHGEAK